MLMRTLRRIFPAVPSLARRSDNGPLPYLALPGPENIGRTQPDLDLLDIPIHDENADNSERYTARGQFLARQERWDDLIEAIRQADIERAKTTDGMPIADLLAFGARADVVHAVEHALNDDSIAATTEPLTDGIAALEAVRREHKDDPYVSAIVALSHVDIGWAWRGGGWHSMLPKLNRDRCAAHFDRAARILHPFCGIDLNSPLIAATRCALLAGSREPLPRLADDYEDLIALDPENHRPMRALGNHMLPRWFGSYRDLDLEARRTAAHTHDVWGAGGYTWVCFDAITQDDEACAVIDPEFFIDGLHDIVAARPDQATVNLLAAYCAVTLKKEEGLNPQADLNRHRISACASWLIRDHLTELHPMIWAHASEGFANNARVMSPRRFAARGKSDGLLAIAEQFQEDIDRGMRVTFTPDGPRIGSA